MSGFQPNNVTIEKNLKHLLKQNSSAEDENADAAKESPILMGNTFARVTKCILGDLFHASSTAEK